MLLADIVDIQVVFPHVGNFLSVGGKVNGLLFLGSIGDPLEIGRRKLDDKNISAKNVISPRPRTAEAGRDGPEGWRFRVGKELFERFGGLCGVVHRGTPARLWIEALE